MAIGAESFVGDASERLASLKKVAASRRSRFSEKKSLRGVVGESARVSVRQSRSARLARREEPNQPLQRNASTRSVSNFESPARRG